jgi:glutaredoxin-like protein
MTGPHDTPATQIDLYWRPGCGYCMMLQRSLDRLGIERVEHDIWNDPADAAIVRAHANGNETVPTVVVGGVGLVNPSATELVAHLAAHHPDLLPDELRPARVLSTP